MTPKVDNNISLSQLNEPRWLEKQQRLAAFVVTSILFIVLNYIKNVKMFPYDAGEYWGLSSISELAHFSDNVRGYFYPLLLGPARFLSDNIPGFEHAPYRIISSVVYAYVFANLLPDFYHTVFGGITGFWRRLIVPLFISILFPGLLVYTLSDIPGLALMLGATACALRSVVQGDAPIRRYFFMFLSGILAYGAYNTRTIYLSSVVAVFAAVPFVIYHGNPLRKRSAATAVFLIGVLIAGIPQAFINLNTQGEFTPAVLTKGNQGPSLIVKQLLWGITVQRYETSIEKAAHPPGVVYMDPAGEQFFIENHLGNRPFTMPGYLELMLEHPLDFLGIYGRHLVNGLDLRDGDSYTVVRSKEKSGLAIFNFLVLFTGLAIMLISAVAHPPNDRQGAERLFWVFVALLPVLMILPGAVETRYFLALHLAIYSAIAFSSDPTAIRVLLKKHSLMVALAFCISAAIFFSVSTATMANMQYDFPRQFRSR